MLKHPYLYKLSNNNGHVFYILGSNHSISFSELPKTCQKLITQTEHLFVELKHFSNGNTSLPPLSYRKLKELDMINPGYSVKDNWFTELSSEDKRLFLQYWNKIKHAYPKSFNFARLRASSIYKELIALSHEGMDFEIERQHVEGQHVGTKTYQIDDLDLREDDTIFDNVATALEIIKSPADTGYYSGELMHNALDPSMVRRNQHFFKQLQIKLPNLHGQSLVVVGVDHLGTEHGLLNQFSNQGYTVERMNRNGRFYKTVYSDPFELKIEFKQGKSEFAKYQEIESAYKTINMLIDRLLDEECYHENNSDLLDQLSLLSKIIYEPRQFEFREFNNLSECLNYYSNAVQQKINYNLKLMDFQKTIDSLFDELLDPRIEFDDNCNNQCNALNRLQDELESKPINEIKGRLSLHQHQIEQLVQSRRTDEDILRSSPIRRFLPR